MERFQYANSRVAAHAFKLAVAGLGVLVEEGHAHRRVFRVRLDPDVLVFGLLVGAVAYLLMPGRAHRSGFKSMAIGEVGSVGPRLGAVVRGVSWLLLEASRRGR